MLNYESALLSKEVFEKGNNQNVKKRKKKKKR